MHPHHTHTHTLSFLSPRLLQAPGRCWGPVTCYHLPWRSSTFSMKRQTIICTSMTTHKKSHEEARNHQLHHSGDREQYIQGFHYAQNSGFLMCNVLYLCTCTCGLKTSVIIIIMYNVMYNMYTCLVQHIIQYMYMYVVHCITPISSCGTENSA